jgi:cyclopropane fatty-acyl-phospholipid synthase-like methyltransferase
MAREYGVEVRGVDLSTNMITLALENQAKQEDEVKRKVKKIILHHPQQHRTILNRFSGLF